MAVDDRFTQDYREPDQDQPAGTRNEIITGPVADWATDFSHLEPEWAADPYPIQDDLRQRCPIAHTERFGGALAADALRGRRGDRLRHRALLLAVDHHEQLPAAAAIWRRSAASPPISSDPPFHHDARKLLLPAFTKTAVAKREPATRAFCHSLIDAFEGRDVVDAAHDYAQHIPMRVIADMLGFPPEDGPQFREFVENRSKASTCRRTSASSAMSKLFDYLLEQIHDHLDDPRDDLTTYLINAELYGHKLEPAHVAGTMALLLIAGIDTTLERDRRVAVAPGEDPGRPRAAGRRARSCCRPRWRSSSGPTRRSRWRGW